MNEKDRCSALKKVRKMMADRLGIELHQTDCTYEGTCRGTCPKCAQEESILNKALLSRAAIGGMAAAAVLGLTGCERVDLSDIPYVLTDIVNRAKGNEIVEMGEVPNVQVYELEGDVAEYIGDEESCDSAASVDEVCAR